MTTAIFSHADCRRHEMGEWHPESPARLQAIDDQLIASRLDQLIERREAPLADVEAIARVHTRNAIDTVRDGMDDLELSGDRYYPLDPDTSLNKHSWNAALGAAGAAIAATDAVIAGELDNAFCAIRPPGHHATPSTSMGFCIFNSVAIAVRHALEVHHLERVAIIDFDVHHGNGTAAAFVNEPRVLMASFFQHPFYPHTPPEEQSPRWINVPVRAFSSGDVVRDLVTKQWLPALHAFKPQMIFISAGFDAHREDDLAQMNLVEADYTWMTRQIVDIAKLYANGRIVSCLEGGYNLSALGRSVVAHLKVLADLE
jgi:acetoin utilization deacetylase AcuC-like enzyme